MQSAALGSCPLGEAGDACRRKVLAKDSFQSYDSAADNKTKLNTAANTGEPCLSWYRSPYRCGGTGNHPHIDIGDVGLDLELA